jgi:hypothetical protein
MADKWLVRCELRVRQAERAQAGEHAIELVDARNRTDTHAIQWASVDTVLADESLFDALRAQLLQQSRSIGFGAERARLDEQRLRFLRPLRRFVTWTKAGSGSVLCAAVIAYMS